MSCWRRCGGRAAAALRPLLGPHSSLSPRAPRASLAQLAAVAQPCPHPHSLAASRSPDRTRKHTHTHSLAAPPCCAQLAVWLGEAAACARYDMELSRLCLVVGAAVATARVAAAAHAAGDGEPPRAAAPLGASHHSEALGESKEPAASAAACQEDSLEEGLEGGQGGAHRGRAAGSSAAPPAVAVVDAALAAARQPAWARLAASPISCALWDDLQVREG